MAFPMLCHEPVFALMFVGSLTSLHLDPVLVSSLFALRWLSIGCGVVEQDTRSKTALKTIPGESTRDRSTWRALTGLGS